MKNKYWIYYKKIKKYMNDFRLLFFVFLQCIVFNQNQSFLFLTFPSGMKMSRRNIELGLVPSLFFIFSSPSPFGDYGWAY